jgi:16S rRNA (adenine1518-N6/adenine1519-N6)-dimethyltransferase
MYAKKSLGQHWLKSEKALSQITAAGNITNTDTVLEIGPGQGVLTERLLKVAGKVIAIEKDRELIPVLQEKFNQEITLGKLELIEADILTFNPNTLKGDYKLIANIPYYITGAIIEQFLSSKHQPLSMVLLMQKEVAERIVAKDGKESIYSIAVKAYGIPKIIDKVPAGAFNPPPKVDSAILYIYDISRSFFKDIDEALFFSVVKAVFGKKRKQIGGSLSDFLQNKDKAVAALLKSGISTTARPETLPLSTWKQLVEALQSEK